MALSEGCRWVGLLVSEMKGPWLDVGSEVMMGEVVVSSGRHKHIDTSLKECFLLSSEQYYLIYCCGYAGVLLCGAGWADKRIKLGSSNDIISVV